MLFTKGYMHIVNLRPTPSKAFYTTYSIFLNGGRLKIKEWSKVMNAHTQLIRDNMNVRKPQVGDGFISILHYGDGPIYLFYGILPRREEQVLGIKNNQVVLIVTMMMMKSCYYVLQCGRVDDDDEELLYDNHVF